MPKVYIKGVIASNDDKEIYEWFGMEATSPDDVARQLDKANGQAIEVDINSPGGDVFSGSEIYTALKDYKGNVNTRIVGVAASMATVVAMAGDTVSMAPTGSFMIHNASMVARGDYRDMDGASTMLKTVNQSVSSAYKLKSGIDDATLSELMDAETWLTAKDALEKGFIDEILYENEFKLSASSAVFAELPQEVLNKTRNLIAEIKNKKEQPEKPKQEKVSLAESNFRLLKLKGINLL